MAIEQNPMQRSILLPATQVKTGTGFTQLAAASQQVSDVLSERLNSVAIDQAATQGELDVQAGKAPDTLALPLNRATKAYNNAVNNTEARRMVATAEQMIGESLANNQNPATFNNETPAKFHSEISGIKEGILQHTRPENREHVREALDKMNANASLSMLKHSIDYDNQKMEFEAKQDLSNLLEQRRNAAIAGDAALVGSYDLAIQQTMKDYSAMNVKFANKSPYILQDIEKQKAVDGVLSQYATALEDKTTAKFLSALGQNKEKMPYSVWTEAVKAVVHLDQVEKSLQNQVVGEQVAQVNLDILKGVIKNDTDLDNYPLLSTTQKIVAQGVLAKKQLQEAKLAGDVITAQRNIISGRGSWNSADVKNKLFKSQINNLEASTGKVATLVDMEQSVLGLNQFPASGIPNIPMGTNVPAFDSTVSQMLTSSDPISTAQAAMVYNDMVNVKGMPNSVSISGEALAVASLFNEINKGGTTPEMAAQLAINKVINATDPQVAQRIETFHKTLEKVNPSTGRNKLDAKFKDVFGKDSKSFGSHEAFRLFQDTFRANYISSNSEEAAFNATKYTMRSWGTSPWFDKGYVGNVVPEKELPITQIANTFGNQFAYNVQGFINQNNQARKEHPELNLPDIQWANPKQTLDKTASDKEKVFNPMLIGSRPRIKINGLETDVVLIPSPESRLSNQVNYTLGVYDQFNNLNPLTNSLNRAEVARFMPVELSKWSPSIADERTDTALRNVAQRIRGKEVQSDGKLEELNQRTPPWMVVLGVKNTDEYLNYIKERQTESNPGRLEAIIESLRGNTNEQVRDKVVDAENTGIEPDDGSFIMPSPRK